MNRQALRDKLAQLSIRIRAQESHAERLKAAGETTKYADANRKLKKMHRERQELFRRLG